jgi:hypothetical protein
MSIRNYKRNRNYKKLINKFRIKNNRIKNKIKIRSLRRSRNEKIILIKMAGTA